MRVELKNVPKRVWFGCIAQTLVVIAGILVCLHMASVSEVGD